MRVLAFAIIAAALTSTVQAQSIVSGTVGGVVVTGTGEPADGVHVILTETTTGLQREVETGSDGEFEFIFLPPGEYSVFAERLGDRPVLVRHVPVRPARKARLQVYLTPATPPITEITEIDFAGGGALNGQEGARSFSRLELERLPLRTRELAELGRFSSVSTGQLATEGLPSRFAGVVVDGVGYSGTGNPGLAAPMFQTAPFAMSFFEELSLLTSGVDVEYGGFAAASLTGYTRRGTQQLEVKAFGDWIGDALTSSDHFNPEDVSQTTVRGGLLLTGPIVRDTSYFVLGVEARRLETPLPRAWEPTSLDSSLVSVAADSFAVDLSPYVNPRQASTDLISAFGRVDWQFGLKNALTVRANVATISADDPDLGPLSPAARGAKLDGTDASALASLTSAFSSKLGLELRLGIEFSERDYSAGDLPVTVLISGPVAFGSDPALPGDFKRFGVRLSETLHLRAGPHRFKLGAGGTFSSIDYTFDFGRGGQFLFADVAGLAVRDGLFVQSVGQVPEAKYSTSEFGLFLQDSWSPIPGLDLTGGFRVDIEVLPNNEIALNDTWRDRTGLSNTSIDKTITKFSPRFGLVWNSAGPRRWQVRADATVHYGSVDAGTFSELAAQSGSGQMRIGLGTLSSWPNPPDSAVAAVQGPNLALLGPDFEPPRSTRISGGVTIPIDVATTLDVSGAYRHTDFLARRHDLNLLPAPASRDQYGRPLFGTMIQRGGLLAADPGSNRRFQGFGTVSALDADGQSDYWSLTARLERRLTKDLNLFASYTHSRAEDNWLSGRGGGPGLQLTPFPDSLNGADWADARSDFDVPDRFTFGAELNVGSVSLAGFYRVQSGLPFTPGFRNGVDANGDGSFRNDPAFIDDQVAGISDLFNQWGCLRGQVGAFAKRNSCRGDKIETLDLRLSLSAVRLGTYPITVTIDGLNLLDSDVADLDRALYLVDGSGSLSVDAATGVVTVPLVANPDFGKPVVRRGLGRAVRIGIRVNYE